MLRNSIDPSFSEGSACAGTDTLNLKGGQHPPECQQIAVGIELFNPLNVNPDDGVSILRNIQFEWLTFNIKLPIT